MEANTAHALRYSEAHSIHLVILAIPEEGRHQKKKKQITFHRIANGGVGCGAASVGFADAGFAATAASDGVVVGGDAAAFNVLGAGAVDGVVPAILGASKFHHYSAK